MPDIRFNSKRFFFDREVVIQAVGRATATAMSKAGAFIRRRAQTSMRYRQYGKASTPLVQPPFAHQPKPFLRKYLYFAYSPFKRSLIVGPVKLDAVYFNHSGEPVTGTVPSIHEFGGEVRQLQVLKVTRRDYAGRFARQKDATFKSNQGTWVKASLKRKSRLGKRRTRLRIIRYPARPYMRPALMAELTNIPRAWLWTVRAA
jgi:hypothetical protein